MPERPWRKGFGGGQRFDLFKVRFQISRHRDRCISSRDLFKDTLLINESAKWKKERKKKKKPPHGGIQTHDISIMGCLSDRPLGLSQCPAFYCCPCFIWTSNELRSQCYETLVHVQYRLCLHILSPSTGEQSENYCRRICDPANIANVGTCCVTFL